MEAEIVDNSMPEVPPTEGGGHETFTKMATKLKEGLKELNTPPAAKVVEQEKPPLPKPNEPAKEAKPEPAKVETKPAEKPTEDEIPPTIKGKAAEEFRNLRNSLTTKFTAQLEAAKAELKTHQDKMLALGTELEAVKKTQVVTPEDLAKLKGERDDLLNRVERLALAESPQFQSKYERAFSHAKNQAVLAAGDKNKELVTAIMEMPPSGARKTQLAAILKEMDPVDQMTLGAALSEMDRARNDRENELSNHRTAIQRLNEENMLAAQQEQARKAAKREILLKNALQTAEEHFAAFKPDPEDPEQAGRITQFRADVEKAMSGNMTESESAMLPVLAAQGVYLNQVQVPKLQARIAALESELKSRAATSPQPERESRSPQPGRGGDPNRSEFVEMFNKARE